MTNGVTNGNGIAAPDNQLNRFDLRLWHRFVAIAQPYWYPTERNGGKIFFGLIALLLVFLFALLALLVGSLTLLVQAVFPTFIEQTAGGLAAISQAMFRPPVVFIMMVGLIVPAIAFFLVRREVLPRWKQWAFLALLLLLSLSVSAMNVTISYVGNFFTSALSEKDAPTFWRFFIVYAGVFGIATPFVVYYRFVQDLLGLRWRDWMTGNFMANYFRDRAYYDINFDKNIDNPDQRISQDVNAFTTSSLSFSLIFLGAFIDVISFTGILLSKSTFLAVFLVIYAIFGTVLISVLGRRLISLDSNQLRKEADFRYGLVHVRDNAESIAFYQGEQQEIGQLRRRFVEVLRNFNFLIGWQRNLGFFRTPYRFATYILPSVILAPIYFAGDIRFGDISQANFAFAQIFEAFALVVLQINALSEFAAGINRLETFAEAIDPDATPALSRDSSPEAETSEIETREDDRIAFNQVTLLTPKTHRMLVQDLTADLMPGQGLVIVGQSGAGKSSLLRAIAGLWDQGSGQITRPNLSDMMFLPQRPYMLLGNLRDQLLYPKLAASVDNDTLQATLQVVNLADLGDRVGGFEVELDWSTVLSLGEQQRLAFARLLLSSPRYAVLDEATSALDLSNEENLYRHLRDKAITFISVGHRPSLLRYHTSVLELGGDTTWRLLPIDEYQVDANVFT